MGWRSSDTVIVFSAFTLPLVSAILAIAAFNDFRYADLSTIELDWICWAFLGFLISCAKVGLLLGDQRALYIQHKDWRWKLGGLWTLSHAIGFMFIFLMWAAVGIIAAQLPNTPIYYSPVDGIPPQFLTGSIFMTIQAVLLGILVFGLICRFRLGEK